ncbi:MAG TPA: hydrogenase iron-sulfur subunit [Calidithermus sp.]|nr:hydrogenase iron-sulfur subunit [Calidithermus sp.]
MFRADGPESAVLTATVPGAATFPPRPRERWHRRLLLRLGDLHAWVEVGLDRVVSSPLNPLYHSGALTVLALTVATVTGIYLFFFYRVGTQAAHASVEAIMAQPLGLGAFVRSLHRYSSDAAVLAAALHGLKMLLGDRFWGARWIGWVTGLALLGLVWLTGVTGYWLVWDAQALVLSSTTARWLDVLPIFGEPVAHTFLSNARIQTFLFFIVLFLHITVPLLIGAFLWVHVMRLARARVFPPRALTAVALTALALISVLWPARSGPPADPARLPGVVPVDWFYFAYLPLARLDAWAGWVVLAGTGGVLLALPWLLRGRTPARARVTEPACTGCMRCYRDCPYDAIVMVPRPGGGRYKMLAVVNPARCVGCGICVGACDTGGILLGDHPVHVLGAAVAARVDAVRARHPGRPPVLAFTCRLLARLEGRLDADGALRDVPGVAVLGLPCVGLLHPDTVTRALAAGAAGVFVAGCVPEDCQFREGSAWLAERLAGRRQPALKRPPAGRLRLRFYAPVEVRRFVSDVRAFAEALR